MVHPPSEWSEWTGCKPRQLWSRELACDLATGMEPVTTRFPCIIVQHRRARTCERQDASQGLTSGLGLSRQAGPRPISGSVFSSWCSLSFFPCCLVTPPHNYRRPLSQHGPFTMGNREAHHSQVAFDFQVDDHEQARTVTSLGQTGPTN